MARSITFQSRSFGMEPSRALEQKQAEEARQRKHGTLHVKAGWSAARRAAEALFAPEPVLASVQGTPSNSGQAGKTGKDLQQ